MNLIMNMLAVPAAVLTLWAVNAQASTNDDIAKRLEPVGKVCVQGQECQGMDVAVSAGGGAKSADDIIATHCTACHSIGLLGAPKVGDTAAWKEREDKEGGLDGLLAKAITGLNAMPPKGTCSECSDAELKSAIEKMSGLK